MKKYKLILVIFALLALTGCRGTKLTQLTEENNKLNEDNLILNERIINVTTENDMLKDQLEEQDATEKDCTFTRTYIVKDLLEYQLDDGISKYAVLDQFQINEPFVVKINNNSQLDLNKFYEFTFSGSTKYRKSDQNFIFKNYKLISTKATNKIGSDQIQEKCQ